MKKLRYAILILVILTAALIAARSPGIYDTVRYSAEVVVLDTSTGCTANFYPYILGEPWVVFDSGGDAIYEGDESGAVRHLLTRCD